MFSFFIPFSVFACLSVLFLLTFRLLCMQTNYEVCALSQSRTVLLFCVCVCKCLPELFLAFVLGSEWYRSVYHLHGFQTEYCPTLWLFLTYRLLSEKHLQYLSVFKKLLLGLLFTTSSHQDRSTLCSRHSVWETGWRQPCMGVHGHIARDEKVWDISDYSWCHKCWLSCSWEQFRCSFVDQHPLFQM